MAFFAPSLNAHAPDAKDRAEEALVANLWKTLIKSSGAMGADSGWGGMAHDAFAEAVAQAVGRTGPGVMPAAADAEAAAQRFALPPPPAAIVSAHAHPAGHAMGHHGGGQLLDLVDGPGRISSAYGPRRDPLGEGHRHHDGVDIAAPQGAAIRAAADGVVTRAGPAGGYGLLVEIRHADGTRTRYAHASRLQVEKGQQIKGGSVIAEVGQSGRATGPHLHFEVRDGSTAINPERALKTYHRRVDSQDKQRLSSGGPRG